MRILIDTNILIQLEDSNKEIADEFAELHKIATKYCQLCVHPKSKEDIQRDNDAKRKKEMLSRIKKYYELESPPQPTADFLKELNSNIDNPRDVVDSHFLFALKHNCVSMLISEDVDLRAKARRCSIENVYRVSEGLSLLKSNYEKIQVEIPHIWNKKLHELRKDDSIFDSLKTDYPEIKDSPSFDKWFIEGQRKGRDSWVYYIQDNIGGICIYKDENNIREYYPGKVLKICTFKVAEQAQGKKVGELLIKNLFMYCIENKYEKAYVTVFEKHSLLIDLFIEFGFQIDSRLTGRGEKIFFKEFSKPDINKTRELNGLDFYSKFSPYFYTKANEEKFIIPIIPQWHTLLFPEYKMSNQQLELFGVSENYSYGNSIKKAYLCNSNIKKLNVGDLIIFYRSQDVKRATTLGIIENIKRSSDADEISAFVGKRTVFPLDSIKQMCKKEVLAILFRQIRHLDGGMSFSELSRRKIVNNRIESITAISHTSFEVLTEKFKDECILANQT